VDVAATANLDSLPLGTELFAYKYYKLKTDVFLEMGNCRPQVKLVTDTRCSHESQVSHVGGHFAGNF